MNDSDKATINSVIKNFSLSRDSEVLLNSKKESSDIYVQLRNKNSLRNNKTMLSNKETEPIIYTEEDIEVKCNEIKKLLKSDTRVRHNIKKLFKEKTINDTIVAVMSLISIILAFFQVIFH
jgi:hypothetical protein